MRLYIAGSSDPVELPIVKRWALEAAERGGPGLEIVSTWIGTVEHVGAGNPTTATLDQRRAWAVQDLEELLGADVLWLIVPHVPTRGAWVEWGFMAARARLGDSVHMIASGPSLQSIFPALGDEHATHGRALEHILELHVRRGGQLAAWATPWRPGSAT